MVFISSEGWFVPAKKSSKSSKRKFFVRIPENLGFERALNAEFSRPIWSKKVMIFTDSFTQELQTLAAKLKSEFWVFLMAQRFHSHHWSCPWPCARAAASACPGWWCSPWAWLCCTPACKWSEGTNWGVGYSLESLVSAGNSLGGLPHPKGPTLTSLICLLTLVVRKYSGVSRTVVYLPFFFS